MSRGLNLPHHAPFLWLLKWSLRGGCAMDGIMAAILTFTALGLGTVPGLELPAAPYIGWLAVVLAATALMQLTAAYDPSSYRLNVPILAVTRQAAGGVLLLGADGCPGLTLLGVSSLVLGATMALGGWKIRP